MTAPPAVIATSTVTATWRAMGTRVVVAVDGAEDLLDRARLRIDELERRWSRFRSDSDVTRMNETTGIPVFVHADTRRLVRHAIAAWERTDGACDATVLGAVVAAGYDASFELLGERTAPLPGDPPVVPGCGSITVDDALGAVTLPAGVGFDPGAIGKGLAADLVVAELIADGASSAFVSIGGDIAMAGRPAAGDGWLVEVVDHAGEATPVARLALADGAVATSTTERRRWRVAGESRHHVIDPATGRPAQTSARTVAVIAGDAWWAEALATQLMLTPPERWADVVGDRAALTVDHDGRAHLLGGIRRYLR